MDKGGNVGKLTAKVTEVSDEGAHFHLCKDKITKKWQSTLDNNFINNGIKMNYLLLDHK
jgi:hypothetical protein